jgi:hypothetical protein
VLGTDYQQEVNLTTLFEDVTVSNQLVTAPVSIPALVDRAVRAAFGSRGVSHLAFPNDLQRTVRDLTLMTLGLDCARALRCVGAINVQCRMQGDRPHVIEINPRFSGGIPLTIAAGADFPRLLVQLARGRTVDPTIGQFQENLWMTSYESSVFVPDADLAFSSTPLGDPIPEVA